MREIYVSAGSLDGTLKHELVHVIAGRFGMPFFGISPRMGLVEGLAMALDGNRGERTLHYYAAAMKEFGVEYNINELLSYSGFMMQAPAKSYVLCGSFVQYLIDHYGIERFRRTYQTGSFESGYERSLQSLSTEWTEFLSQIKVPDADEAHVRYRFRRLPVFQKTCARVTAEWINDAGGAFRQKNYTAASMLYRHAYDETGSEDAVLGYLQSEFRRGEYDSVTASSPAKHRPPLMPMADLLTGDAWMMKGDSAKASRFYTALLESNILRSYSELAAIRLSWLAQPHQNFVMRQFYRVDEDSLRIDVLQKILLMPAMDTETRSLYEYLLLRLSVNMHRYSDALNTVSGEEYIFRYSAMNYSNQVLRAAVFEHFGEWEKAKLHYWRALNYTQQETAKSWIEDRIELCNWFERHKAF
jgi:tetratricopeptide (TPR) repeat protein